MSNLSSFFFSPVLRNGDIEVGVHIADVTHFLKHKSALDKEASKRATTFYLVDRRFDMLPSLLSSGMFSLSIIPHISAFVEGPTSSHINLRFVLSPWEDRSSCSFSHLDIFV